MYMQSQCIADCMLQSRGRCEGAYLGDASSNYTGGITSKINLVSLHRIEVTPEVGLPVEPI